VHLGLDTVQLQGEGFTAHVREGDRVAAGQPVITYDVPAVEAAGRNPIVPVVVMDKQQADIAVADAVAAGAQLAARPELFVVNH
jgi:phosphotransferase system IIA component